MNKAEKAVFVHELVAHIEQAVLEKVNRMPDTWDGIELREYVADLIAESCLLHDRSWHISKHRNRDESSRRALRRRARNYQNDVIVRNL